MNAVYKSDSFSAERGAVLHVRSDAAGGGGGMRCESAATAIAV